MLKSLLTCALFSYNAMATQLVEVSDIQHIPPTAYLLSATSFSLADEDFPESLQDYKASYSFLIKKIRHNIYRSKVQAIDSILREKQVEWKRNALKCLSVLRKCEVVDISTSAFTITLNSKYYELLDEASYESKKEMIKLAQYLSLQEHKKSYHE